MIIIDREASHNVYGCIYETSLTVLQLKRLKGQKAELHSSNVRD